MAEAGASDVVVIGAGAWGLWAARACLARGMSVTVADAGGPRASETPVGALAPHAPDRWSAMAEWQMRALLGWAAEAAALEAETGIAVGYGRVGRLTPLASEAERARAERLVEAAAIWGGAARMAVTAGREGWLGAAPHGALRDDLTARVDAPRMLAALRAAVAPRARRLEGWRFEAWEPGCARFDRGEVRAGSAILAAGWEGLRRLGAGEPEHGQAARLRVRAPEGAEVLAGPGLWVVPHADGTVGVGATAERGREDLGTDGALEGVLARARALCPALEGAETLERWAGLRPRPEGRRPALGPVPGAPGLIAALGGWRIGLALAPEAGRAAAAFAAGERPALPEGLALREGLARGGSGGA